MKAFRVYRDTPPKSYEATGLSNLSSDPDFEGVIFSDGSVAVRWRTLYASHVIWPDWRTLYMVHIEPHQNYGTRVEFSEISDWIRSEPVELVE